MKIYFAILFLTTFSIFPKKELQKKNITDNEFNYSFYVISDLETSQKIYKNYFWYKSGKIHNSIGGNNGQLLHGNYTKSFKNNNICEKGLFKKGLKNGVWKIWNSNGSLKEVSIWKNGVKSGEYLKFSELGVKSLQGKYKKNLKNGRWINYDTNDTIYFKNGVKVEKKKNIFKLKTKAFLKKIFSKKKNKRKKEKKSSSKPSFKEKFKTFFKKLFSKKEKKNKANNTSK